MGADDAALAVEYDQRVAEMGPRADIAFRSAAEIMAGMIETGEGGRIALQPGDMTRYEIVIASRRRFTVSDGEEMTIDFIPITSTEIAFGTVRAMSVRALGGAHRISPEHPWTAAVWRRLFAALMERLPEEI